uniref:Odorant-binding protein 4 n=1 Tax=Locusta migratoria manilensis TaxID=229990 RepID=G9G6R2_LOCMI|nr:odorant-binding protein 4 [Locusta migratoria manilensis]
MGTAVAAAVLLLVAVANAEDSLMEIVIREVKGCMDSEHLNSIADLRSYNEAKSPEEKCFLGCMLKKFKALDADGQYDAEGLKATIQHCPRMKAHPNIQQAALQVADECAGKVTGCSDYCTCAPLATRCLHEGMKNKSFQTIFIALDEALDKMQS